MIEFALSDREIAVRSFDEFLGEAPASEVGDEELVFGLFTDWFIFNYCTRRSLSYLNEYILVNPDNLDGAALSRLKDISQSHWYGGFEICSIKVGEYLDLEHLFSGKKIRVFDRLGSKNSPNEGVILCRVAKVEGHYCLVSGDPLLLPLNHTPRLKQMMKKKKVDFCSSLEMALKILLSPKSPAPEYFSLQDILRKRRELEKEYRNLCHQYKDLPSYEKLAKEIYEEEKEESFFDIVDSLFRTESAKKVFVDNGQVFQDLWNFLPPPFTTWQKSYRGVSEAPDQS